LFISIQMKDSLVQELQQKAEETELLQVELQMLETERVRLSLVEEKLLDVLQLLQHLRDLVSQSVSQSVTHQSQSSRNLCLFVERVSCETARWKWCCVTQGKLPNDARREEVASKTNLSRWDTFGDLEIHEQERLHMT